MEHIATIEIPDREVMYWNDRIESKGRGNAPVDWNGRELLACWTAKFDDGATAEIRVWGNRAKDRGYYDEGVLYDRDGNKLAQIDDPNGEVDGTWYFYHGPDDELHSVVVVGV